MVVRTAEPSTQFCVSQLLLRGKFQQLKLTVQPVNLPHYRFCLLQQLFGRSAVMKAVVAENFRRMCILSVCLRTDQLEIPGPFPDGADRDSF